MKNIPINPNLPLQRCWDMVNRIDTVAQANVAEAWLRANNIIDNEQFDDLMMALCYQRREAYHEGRIA